MSLSTFEYVNVTTNVNGNDSWAVEFKPLKSLPPAFPSFPSKLCFKMQKLKLTNKIKLGVRDRGDENILQNYLTTSWWDAFQASFSLFNTLVAQWNASLYFDSSRRVCDPVNVRPWNTKMSSAKGGGATHSLNWSSHCWQLHSSCSRMQVIVCSTSNN